MKDRVFQIDVPSEAAYFSDGRVNPGWLVGELFGALQSFGVDLEGSAYLARIESMEFLAPVYHGDKLEARFQLSDDRPEASVWTFSLSKGALHSAGRQVPTHEPLLVLSGSAVLATPSLP